MWTPTYFVRPVSLPASIDGITVPNDDGTFDIYINAGHCEAKRRECLQHEIRHIMDDHFYQDAKSVTELEREANGAVASLLSVSPFPPHLPDIFAEHPAGTIPFFVSLDAFQDYVFSMRDQVQ